MHDSFIVHQPRPTHFIHADRLSRRFNTEITLAVETFQHTGSFKYRAAFNVATSVPNSHLLTASSGNFGQALAKAASITGKRCTVVMPQTSAVVKVDAVRSFGAEVDLIDITKISRDDRIAQLREQFPDAYFASPFDDPYVIQGNMSLGEEIAERGFDVVVAPVGGGGLASGLVLAFAKCETSPHLLLAEPALANDFARSIRVGERLANATEPQTLADGARTRSVGVRNWDVLSGAIKEVIEVSEENIRVAVRLLFEENVKSEPTGAVSTAALLQEPNRSKGVRVCCVVTGGNVDPELFAQLIRH